MREIRPPLPVKLFFAMLANDRDVFAPCEAELSGTYGPLDLTSDIMPWNGSDHYHPEMGAPLFRRFIFFRDLIDPLLLSDIKRSACAMEHRFSANISGCPHRRINLDPGYITEAKVVLSTVKDYAHRLPIGNGIYAEVTLRFSVQAAGFTPFEHTYFDYRERDCLNMFKKARELLRSELQRCKDE